MEQLYIIEYPSIFHRVTITSLDALNLVYCIAKHLNCVCLLFDEIYRVILNNI